MGINRISSGLLTDQSSFYLNNNLLNLSNLQEKLSSGHNINQPSDDPVGLTRILALSNTLSTDDRYSRNIDDAIAETNLADSTMSSMTELAQKAKEIATQGANFSNNQSGLNALALQVDQLVNQMVQLGNTNIGGKYIFSGMATNTPPFTRTNDDVAYTGTPPTENFARPAEVSQGVTLNINVNGQNMLGSVGVVSTNPPTFTAGSSGILKTLINLKLDLQNGKMDQVRLRIDDLGNDLNTVLSQQAQIAAIENRLDLSKSRIDERKSTFTQQYASIQNIDTAKTISDLNFQQNVFQQSLGVAAKVLQTSLLDYLK